jgi:hypothetical protein
MMYVVVFADSSAQTATARDAFHPQPQQHGIHISGRIRTRRRFPHKRNENALAAHTVCVYAMQFRLHASLEVGNEGQKQRYIFQLVSSTRRNPQRVSVFTGASYHLSARRLRLC